MVMTESIQRFLRRLRDAQPEGLPQSKVSPGSLSVLTALETCGAVRRRSVGRGIVIRICNNEAFDRFINARYPGGLDEDRHLVTDRSSAVIAFGDAKAIRRGSAEGIFIRTANPGMIVRSLDGSAELQVGKQSAEAGGAALLLTSNRQWMMSGTIAVIENAEPFWYHERILPSVDLAIFATGNMSARLINWLSSAAMANCSYIHWGDYDPRGMCEYLRLCAACPERVTTYIPTNIEVLLQRFGNRDLLIKQAKDLDRLRDSQSDPIIKDMVRLFDHYRRGLEQEVLLAE